MLYSCFPWLLSSSSPPCPCCSPGLSLQGAASCAEAFSYFFSYLWFGCAGGRVRGAAPWAVPSRQGGDAPRAGSGARSNSGLLSIATTSSLQLLWLQLKHKTRARVSMETSPALRISEDLVPQGPRSAPCLSLGERRWGCSSSSTVPHPDPEVSSSCSVPEPWELLVRLLRVLYYPN